MLLEIVGCNTYPYPSGPETTITNLRSFLNRTIQQKRRNNKKQKQKECCFLPICFSLPRTPPIDFGSSFYFIQLPWESRFESLGYDPHLPTSSWKSAVLHRQRLTEDFLDGRLLVSMKYEPSFTCKYSLIILILVSRYILTPLFW